MPTRAAAPPDPPAVSAANAASLAAFANHLATRSAHTRSAYLHDVAQLAMAAGETPLSALRRAQLSRILGTLHARGLGGRSLARMLSAWRAFYRFLREHDRTVAEDPLAGLKAPKSPKRLPSALSPDEAVRLVAIPGDDTPSLCDRALFELAYSSGLRLSELAGLDVDRVDLAGGEVRVWGKGAKERVVPVGAAARTAIAAWLAQRSTLAGVREPGTFRRCHGPAPIAAHDRAAPCDVGDRQGLSATCIRTCCATRSPRTCCSRRAICVRCRRCWAMRSIASTQVYTHLDFQALAKVYDAAHPRAKRRSK